MEPVSQNGSSFYNAIGFLTDFFPPNCSRFTLKACRNTINYHFKYMLLIMWIMQQFGTDGQVFAFPISFQVKLSSPKLFLETSVLRHFHKTFLRIKQQALRQRQNGKKHTVLNSFPSCPLPHIPPWPKWVAYKLLHGTTHNVKRKQGATVNFREPF